MFPWYRQSTLFCANDGLTLNAQKSNAKADINIEKRSLVDLTDNLFRMLILQEVAPNGRHGGEAEPEHDSSTMTTGTCASRLDSEPKRVAGNQSAPRRTL